MNSNKRAASKIFDNFCDDVKCFLRKGDVAWIVSLRRGASMYIHGREYVIQGMTDRTMKLKDSMEAEELPIYEIMHNKKILDVVFLSELKVWFENKIVKWSWSPEEEEEEDDHSPPPTRARARAASTTTTRKRTRMCTPSSSEEDDQDDEVEEDDDREDEDDEESLDVAEYEDTLSEDDQRRKNRDKEDREWIMGQMRVEQSNRRTTMRSEPRIGDLYCTKCGGFYNHSDFSRDQVKASIDDRFCLRHTSTSDFNRPAIVNVTDEGEGEVY